MHMTLANQANKALLLLIKLDLVIQTQTSCVNSMTHSYAEYGNEIWGYHPCPENETIHLKFCKFVLGVPVQAILISRLFQPRSLIAYIMQYGKGRPGKLMQLD